MTGRMHSFDGCTVSKSMPEHSKNRTKLQENSTRYGLLAGLALVLAATAAPAQERSVQSWNEEKCARYTAAWHEALSRLGREGLGTGFVAAHEAFLAAGCRGPRRACPRSEAELRMADAMTAAAVNARIAGSFLPFGCPG